MSDRWPFERLLKLSLVLWVCIALALQTWLLHYSWRQLPLYVLVATVGMAGLSWFDRRSVAAVLGTAYVFPVLVLYLRGLQSGFFMILWLAAVLGVMLPDLLRSPWHLPRRWRLPLAFSAFAVAISAIVMMFRETDGVPVTMFNSVPGFWQGYAPQFTLRWVLHVSLSLIIGIFWFDWLYGARDLDFERVIVTPLVVSALLLGLTVTYQVFVDDHFLNGTVFQALGRATGTMFDANVAGMLAALWLGGIWLWAAGLGGWRWYLLPPAVGVMAVAVWGSGSRTAFLAGACAAVGVGISLLIRDRRFHLRRAVAVVALLASASALLLVLGLQSTNINNPIVRLSGTFKTSPAATLLGLWNRDGYGTAAIEMIRLSPLAGVGIGAYHGLVAEFGARFHKPLPPDNAQNWLRHQIAELGALGAAGWVVWFVMFAIAVCVPRRGEPSSIWIARATLIGFGGISMLGMPGQDPMVGLTFWTFACWYLRLRDTPVASKPASGWMIVSGGVVLLLFAVASTAVARGPLRLPERALREHQPLSYGYGPLMTSGADSGFRVVNARAATVIEPDAPWLLVSMRVSEQSTTPVDVRVWLDEQVVLKARLVAGQPFTGVVDIGGRRNPMLFEVSAWPDGQWWRRPFRVTSDVVMKWEFVSDVAPRFKVPRRPNEGEKN